MTALVPKLKLSTIRWLIRNGGVPYCTHMSDDYPRELEAKGLVTREGPGMLGHLHVLRGTEAGRAYDLALLDTELAKLPEPIRQILGDAMLDGRTVTEPLAPYPDITWRDRGRLRLTHWGMHLSWRLRQIAREQAACG